MQKIITKIVSHDQQGYIKNRVIGYNIRTIQDVIDYSEKLQTEGAIIFLDFRKAYDTLEWNFLFGVLKYFGFKATFIQWVETFYNDIR